jgi:hypothetical protein
MTGRRGARSVFFVTPQVENDGFGGAQASTSSEPGRTMRCLSLLTRVGSLVIVGIPMLAAAHAERRRVAFVVGNGSHRNVGALTAHGSFYSLATLRRTGRWATRVRSWRP